MEKEQTAMQMLMQQINELADRDLRPEFLLACGKIYNKATELLPVERKEIEDAFKDPYRKGRVHPGNNMNKDFADFFSTRYGD